MIKVFTFMWLVFTITICNAQHKKTDTLLLALKRANTDTTRLVALLDLTKHYWGGIPDSAIIFGQQAYTIAEKNKWADQTGRALNSMANAYSNIGDYVKAMQFYYRALRIYERIHDLKGASIIDNNIGNLYITKRDDKNAIPRLWLARKLSNEYSLTHTPDILLEVSILENMGEAYLDLKQTDSAESYLNKCYKKVLDGHLTDITGAILRDLGEIEAGRNNKGAALKYFRNAIADAVNVDDLENQSIAYLSIASLYHKDKLQDSAEYYAQKALEMAAAGKFEQDVLNAGQILYSYYDEDQNTKQAYKYFKVTTAAKDSIYSQDKLKQLLSIEFDERQRKADLETAQTIYQEQVRTYGLLAALLVLLLLAIIFWRNSRQNKKANIKIQSTLDELKITQQQLIQSEKLASLGELTAGIAHEIQNPLNFVNNFSEVSVELIDEMQAELKNGDKDEAFAISEDLKQNLEKIHHHGKRADFIVRGMLEHSRTSKGEKTLTDINVLADEFFKLSYHGLRAKDKNFNAELITHFDGTLPKMEAAQQDIGRVLLNLFNNAFYAVNQKKRSSGGDYRPTVELSTFAPPSGGWGVKVRDNGCGIPESIKDKIMQPFFTTKPASEGTGLGLSLSYDIVVKGHGGSITADTKEGEFTQFTIYIPLAL